MKKFFDEDVLLGGEFAKQIYAEVKELPIIDYHCHLDPSQIASDLKYENIGQMWLAADHYKWRVMRMCGVDEKYITGDADWEDKFFKFAGIMPKLVGNPVYYWSHFELKQIFGINLPLNEKTAAEIFERANKKLKEVSVQKLLTQFKVEYIATTDDPSESLSMHKKYCEINVAPTFRPDKILQFDTDAICKLEIAAQTHTETYTGLLAALGRRLDFFLEKGCRLADHAFYDFPKSYLPDTEAESVYKHLGTASEKQFEGLRGNLFLHLMREYKKRDIAVQLHFSVVRNVNSVMNVRLGADTGFDVMGSEPDYQNVITFLNKLPDKERPVIILYSLNSNAAAPLACISGAFRNVYIGAAWWFNDTLEGIKHNLSAISEYACLGTNLGMLTDSRSFSSYSRFDFFRRILCSYVGEMVDNGEYSAEDALTLVKNICYYNIKNLLKL